MDRTSQILFESFRHLVFSISQFRYIFKKMRGLVRNDRKKTNKDIYIYNSTTIYLGTLLLTFLFNHFKFMELNTNGRCTYFVITSDFKRET